VAIGTLERNDQAEAPQPSTSWPAPGFVAVTYLLSRLCVLAGFAVASAFQSGMSFSRIPVLWDGRWYLRLASEGYPGVVPETAGKATESTLAFFPLFPLLIRILSAVPGVSDATAGLVLSSATGGLAAWLVYRLAARLAGPGVARRATVLFCFFPGTIVFSLVYSEGLMIALAAGCLLALHSRRWVLAGGLAGLATACRPNAVVLVVVCAWAAAEAVRRRRDIRSLAAPALAISGMAAFLGSLWLQLGEPGAWWRVQHEGWNQQVDFGRTLLAQVAWAVKAPFGNVERVIVVAGLMFAATGFVALIRLVRRRGWPVPLLVYTAGILGMASAYRVDVFRPRAVLAAFPLFLALGDAMSRRTFTVVVTLGAVALVALPWYYALPFASSSSP
jgi:hypothetical protein